MIKELSRKADKQYLAAIALLMVAVSWGATFVVVADAVASYPIYAFLALRFAVAAISFVLFFPRVMGRLTKENITFGAIAGLILTAGYIFQTLGLLPPEDGGTTPARTAFLTGMYVVIVPVVQSAWKRRFPGIGTSLGMVLALAGLWAFSGISIGSGQGSWNLGDTYVLLSSLAYSAHMLLLGRTTHKHNTLALTLVQLLTVFVASALLSIFTGEHAGIPTTWNVWFAILICGIVASALAFAVQTWAQRILPASRVALILISEPALGGIFGWWALGSAPGHELIGAGLMLSGMIASESLQARTKSRKARKLKRAVEGMPIYVDNDPHRRDVEELEV